MKLQFSNIPEFEPKKVNLPEAPFLSYKPKWGQIKAVAQEFGSFSNIIIIGHGGSISSFIGIYEALKQHIRPGFEKNVTVLSTIDPDYVAELKKTFAKDKTLVIAISKSGENITQLENVLQFIDYPLIFVCGENTPLEQIAKKIGAKVVKHPAIGGRYVGLTDVALLPAAICGIDIEKIYKGGRQFYDLYSAENIAMQAAQIFFELEQRGFVDVFMPFYSHALYPFSHLIVQLCHESFGKNGVGQTYLAAESPESQHHTNQRFFGGRRNIAGFFIDLENFATEQTINVPPSLRGIAIKDGDFFRLNGMPLSYSMRAEFHGTLEDAKINSIPVAALDVSHISEEEIGAFIAFWQMYAVYSSVLREVNPFDQPQVENSKKLSWNKRKEFKA